MLALYIVKSAAAAFNAQPISCEQLHPLQDGMLVTFCVMAVLPVLCLPQQGQSSSAAEDNLSAWFRMHLTADILCAAAASTQSSSVSRCFQKHLVMSTINI